MNYSQQTGIPTFIVFKVYEADVDVDVGHFQRL